MASNSDEKDRKNDITDYGDKQNLDLEIMKININKETIVKKLYEEHPFLLPKSRKYELKLDNLWSVRSPSGFMHGTIGDIKNFLNEKIKYNKPNNSEIITECYENLLLAVQNNVEENSLEKRTKLSLSSPNEKNVEFLQQQQQKKSKD